MMLQEFSNLQMKQIWVCHACTYENKSANAICQMCDETNNSIRMQKVHHGQQQLQQDKNFANKGVECITCSFINENYAMQCSVCGENLMQQKPQEFGMEQKSMMMDIEKQPMIKCDSCSMQNDPNNPKCVFCDCNLKVQKLKQANYLDLEDNKKQCKFCGMSVRQNRLKDHQKDCQNSLKLIHGQIDESKKITCPYCWNKYYPQAIRAHTKNCQEKQKIFKNTKSFGRLTKLQLKTIQYMHEKCQSLHFDAIDSLKKKVHSLGYSDEDLQNLHHYIANYAPIIIHMRIANHMQFFVKDTHYRNQFEVYKRNNTARVSWEDRMFDNKHHSATYYQRVKYGTINFTNDPKGVRACCGYGPSYFLLKEDVRDRCTLTDMDSASSTATIGTFRFCFHVLLKLNDKQLKGAFTGSKATEVNSEGVITSYKQIQIHGPVEFKEDIQRMYVDKVQFAPQFEEMVDNFCEQNKVEYETFQIHPGPLARGFGFPTKVKPAIKKAPVSCKQNEKKKDQKKFLLSIES